MRAKMERPDNNMTIFQTKSLTRQTKKIIMDPGIKTKKRKELSNENNAKKV